MYVFQYTGLRCTLSWDGVAAEHYSVADAYQPPAMEHAEVTCVFSFLFFLFPGLQQIRKHVQREIICCNSHAHCLRGNCSAARTSDHMLVLHLGN